MSSVLIQTSIVIDRFWRKAVIR